MDACSRVPFRRSFVSWRPLAVSSLGAVQMVPFLFYEPHFLLPLVSVG